MSGIEQSPGNPNEGELALARLIHVDLINQQATRANIVPDHTFDRATQLAPANLIGLACMELTGEDSLRGAVKAFLDDKKLQKQVLSDLRDLTELDIRDEKAAAALESETRLAKLRKWSEGSRLATSLLKSSDIVTAEYTGKNTYEMGRIALQRLGDGHKTAELGVVLLAAEGRILRQGASKLEPGRTVYFGHRSPGGMFSHGFQKGTLPAWFVLRSSEGHAVDIRSDKKVRLTKLYYGNRIEDPEAPEIF